MTFRRIPVPFERRFVVDSLILGESKHAIHGLMDVDVTRARRLYRERGDQISWTAYVVACVARSVAAHPQVHALRSLRGDLVIFDTVDVCTFVEIVVGDRTYPMPIVLAGAERRSVADLSREIRDAQESPRSGSLMPDKRSMRLAGRIPGPLRRLVMRLFSGVPSLIAGRVGTVGVTAVGMFGRGAGYGIPFPTVHSMGVTVGGIVERPRFAHESGDRVERGEFMQLTVSVDHDIVDGGPAARFASDLASRLEAAELLESAPRDSGTPSS